MIKVKLTKNNNYYKRIIITGHANYDDFGKDIVCASVSSLITCTVNGIYSLNKNSILYKDDSNTIEIKILDDENALKLFNNLILMLKDLAKDYPKNIKIESEK